MNPRRAIQPSPSTPPAPTLRSFSAIVSTRSRVLVLGSMPGAASLAAARYYAHPRNQFWPIMGALVGAGPEHDYAHRLQVLDAAGVALWDVLATCVRPGSLDASIAADSIVSNAFEPLFASYPNIRHVFFNGSTASTLYRRWVLPGLSRTDFVYQRLPSTSPAHAALSFEQKLAAWRPLREALAQSPAQTPR